MLFVKNRTALVCTCLLTLSLNAIATDLVKLRVNVQAEKKNIDILFKNAAVATLGDAPASEINGLTGSTTDFDGQELPVYIIFNQYLSTAQTTRYAEKQFRLEGVVHCEIAQKGNSPDIPLVKLAVLGQNCVIKKINA